MSASEALERLKHGSPVACVTPEGTSFSIESKFSHGLAWYRARPARKGCLNRYSRLSDAQLLQWLESVTIAEYEQ